MQNDFAVSPQLDYPYNINNANANNPNDTNFVNQLNRQIQDYKSQISKLQHSNQNLETQCQNAKQDANKFKQALEQTKRENQQLRAQVVELAKKASLQGDNLNPGSMKSSQGSDQSDDESAEIQLKKAQTRITGMEQTIDKIEKQKIKLAKKCSSLQKKVDELNSELSALKVEKNKIELENQTIYDDVKTKQMELDLANASRSELESKILTMNNTLKNKISSLDSMQEAFDKQRKEIAVYSKERQDFTQLIHKLNLALTVTTTKYGDLLQENELLKKSQAKPLLFQDLSDISTLNIPFTGSLGTKCANIIKLEQYEPFQRVQLIINEANKELAQVQNKEAEFEEQLKKLNDENLNDKKKADLLRSLMKGLKVLVDTEKQFEPSAFCDEDQHFMEFMASHFSDFSGNDPSQKEYFTNDVYVSPSIDNRRKAIEQLKTNDQTALAMIQSLFLYNIKLFNQNRKMISNLIQKKELTKLGKIIGAKRYEEIPQKLEVLIKQLHDQKKQLQKCSREPIIQTTDNTQINETIGHLQDMIASLRDENQSLRNASNEAVNKKFGSWDEAVNKLKGENGKLSNDIKNFENLLKEKDDEIEQLQAQLKDNEQAAINWTIQVQQYNTDRTNLESKIREYQKIINALEARINEIQKKAKKKIKLLKKQHLEEKDKLSESYEQVKDKYEQSIQLMKNRFDQMHEISKNMSLTHSRCEKRNQELEEENSILKAQQQNLSNQISVLTEQSKIDKQKFEEEEIAKFIKMQNQLQDEFKNHKDEVNSKNLQLRQMLVNTIGAKYGINDPNFSNENCERLLERVQSDLRKLQMFQDNSTAQFEH